MLGWGATRVVIGTKAATDPALVERLLARHGPEQMADGIDAKDGQVAVRGWTEVFELTALQLAQRVKRQGARTVIYTDVARDGMLAGPDVAGARTIAALGLETIASGGVAALDDPPAIRAPRPAGAVGGRGPSAGRFPLPPAPKGAAGRGGPLSIVTDGAIDDVVDVPPDLLRRARIVQLPRPPFFDAYVAAVDGPRRVAAGDTLRLKVSYGTAGKTAGENAGARGRGQGTLALYLAGRRVVSRVVALPDSGTVFSEITLPPALFTGSARAGWQALEVRLDGVAGDSEPRDDARVFVLEGSPPPSVVLLASPPDWDSRFLARTLSDVARVPVRTFVESEPGGGGERGWRDGASLAPVSVAEVARAVAGGGRRVRRGDPAK